MIIFKASIKRIFKNKIKLLILLLMPLIFIMMFALQRSSYITIGIVDEDNSELSRKLSDSIKKMDKVRVMILDEDEVYDKAVSYQTDYSIIIRNGFEEKLLSGKSLEVEEFYINEKEKLFYARNFVDTFINNMKVLAGGVNYDKSSFEIALNEYDKDRLAFKGESHTSEEASQSRAAMGFLVQFMLYMSVITAGLISEDKISGVFYRTFYAPVSIKKYLLENLAAFIITGVMQVVVILTLVKYVLGLGLGVNTINMYILFTIFALVCISLGILIVSLFKKPIFAYTVIVLITTPMLMLGGCYWPKEFMPDIMNKIATFIPTSWAMSAVDKLVYDNAGLMDITLELLILLLFTGIFMAGGLFKKVDVSK